MPDNRVDVVFDTNLSGLLKGPNDRSANVISVDQEALDHLVDEIHPSGGLKVLLEFVPDDFNPVEPKDTKSDYYTFGACLPLTPELSFAQTKQDFVTYLGCNEGMAARLLQVRDVYDAYVYIKTGGGYEAEKSHQSRLESFLSYSESVIEDITGYKRPVLETDAATIQTTHDDRKSVRTIAHELQHAADCASGKLRKTTGTPEFIEDISEFLFLNSHVITAAIFAANFLRKKENDAMLSSTSMIMRRIGRILIDEIAASLIMIADLSKPEEKSARLAEKRHKHHSNIVIFS